MIQNVEWFNINVQSRAGPAENQVQDIFSLACWSAAVECQVKKRAQKRDKAGGLELVRGAVQVPTESERGDISRKGTFLLEDVQFVNDLSKGARRVNENNNVNWLERCQN